MISNDRVGEIDAELVSEGDFSEVLLVVVVRVDVIVEDIDFDVDVDFVDEADSGVVIVEAIDSDVNIDTLFVLVAETVFVDVSEGAFVGESLADADVRAEALGEEESEPVRETVVDVVELAVNENDTLVDRVGREDREGVIVADTEREARED